MDLEGRRVARRQTMTLKRKRNRSRRSVACEDIYTRQAERVGLRPEAKGLQHQIQKRNDGTVHCVFKNTPSDRAASPKEGGLGGGGIRVFIHLKRKVLLDLLKPNTRYRPP